MTGFFILFGGIALFATVIGVLDLLARRQHRKTQRPVTSAAAAAALTPPSRR